MALRNINQFKETFKELARNNRFEILPSTATPPIPELCISASVHGINIDTLDYRNGMDTAAWKQPYGTSYPDLTLTFNDDQEMKNRSFYEKWIEETVKWYGVEYHDNYARDTLQIAQMGRDGEIKKIFQFWNVYPLNITPLQFESASQNGFTTFSVTLDHHDLTGYPFYQGNYAL